MHELGLFNITEETLNFICRKLPWILLILWAIYAIAISLFTKQLKKATNYYVFESIPSVFVTIGLLGTFLGITYGLVHFDVSPEKIKDSIQELLIGLKTAFYTSIFGIIMSLIFKKVVNYKLSTGMLEHPLDVKEFDYLSSINNNLISIREHSISTAQHLEDIKTNKLDNIAKATNGLQYKLDKFFEDMAEQSAGAIESALKEVIEDFNETFKTFIGQLVEKNFDKLSKSVDTLVTWQGNYRNDIIEIKNAYEALAKNHKNFVITTEDWVSKLDEIAGSSSQLQHIINDFQSAFDDESRFSDVISKINESIDNLRSTSEIVNKHTLQLSDTTEAFTNTKEEISTWLNNESSVREMVISLSSALTELKQFEVTQFENLDKEFQIKLNNTFKGLDDVMRTQLKLVESKLK